jgi:hypothetical protein
MANHALIWMILILAFFVTGCTSAGETQKADAETDGDRDAGEASENDSEIAYDPCGIADYKQLISDESTFKTAKQACEQQWFRYDDAVEGCYDHELYGDGTRSQCCAKSFTVGEAQGLICESYCGECNAPSFDPILIWPGPGFGCFSTINPAPVGWHGIGAQTGNDCLANWTDEKLAFILNRSGPDATPCESITDLTQCLGTHNPPAHCQAVLGWPLDMLDQECRFDHYQLDSQADLDRAQFIGCTTVYEYKNPLADTSVYSGVIKKDTGASCLYFSGYEADIPEGYSKSDCAACGK